MSDTHKYWSLTERLDAKSVPFSIEDMGSGVMGLFIPDGTSEFNVTPSEGDEGTWLVLRSASREDWWGGNCDIIDESATTDEVMRILTQFGVVHRHSS